MIPSIKRLFATGNDLRGQIVRGVMGVGGLKLLSLSLTLLTTIVLARGLGPDGFGQYAFVVSFITVLSIPLGPAPMLLTTREVAGFQQAGEVGRIFALLRWTNRKVWHISIVFIALIGGYVAWLAKWQTNDRRTLIFIAIAALPFIGLSQVRAGVLTGMKRVVLAQLPELLVRPVILLFMSAALMSLSVLNPLSAVAAFGSVAAIAFLIGVWLLRLVFPVDKSSTLINAGQTRKWRRAWIPFILLVAASTLNTQIGILFLGWLSSDDQIAAMRVAERGGMLVALSITVINIVIGPHIAEAYRSADLHRLKTLFRQSARAAILIALPIAIPLILFSKPIIITVFGSDYADLATRPLVILTAGRLINVAFGAIGMFLAMCGFERDTTYSHLLAFAVNALVAYALIPSLGATGAAIAAISGLTVWTIVLSLLVFKRLKIRCSPF